MTRAAGGFKWWLFFVVFISVVLGTLVLLLVASRERRPSEPFQYPIVTSGVTTESSSS